MLDQLRRDLLHASRNLARIPVLALVVVASLGVGIGVNTAVFSWVQTFVFTPIPGVDEAGGFYSVEARAEGGSYPGVSWAEYRDLRRHLTTFDQLLAFRMTPVNVGEASRTERTFALLVSGNYFPGLGLAPALGRFIRHDEAETPGLAPVVVLSYDYWQTRFAGEREVLGRAMRVNNTDVTIVGVAPEGFLGTVLGLQFDLWMPATMAPVMGMGPGELGDRTRRGYQVIGRLREGVTAIAAETEMALLMRRLAADYPASNANMHGELRPFWQAPRGPQMMFLQALLVLQALMLLVLLAVCGNAANLLLARAAGRRREIGVHLALGAGPWRIVRLLAAEHLVLGLAGAALGALLAAWGTTALRAVPFASMGLPIRFESSLDLAGLSVAMLLGVASAAVFGLAPTLFLARVDPQQALVTGADAPPRRRLRDGLMAAQVALAVAVLLVAGLFWRSFRDTRELDPGFVREGVLLAAYDLSNRALDDEQLRTFATRLLQGLEGVAGVETAAIAQSVPLDIHGLPLAGFALEGRAESERAPDRALRNVVTPGYFQTMRIQIVAGRDFSALTDTAAPPEAIVNQAFADRYSGTGLVLGRRIDAGRRTYTIVGVVRNSMAESFGETPIPTIYYSYRDRPSSGGEVHVRTRAGAEAMLAADVRRVVRDLDESLPVYNVRTLTEHVDTNLVLRRLPARLFVVLGPLLLGLASVGIYAVVSYAVARRTREIGVRLALGATAGRVRRQIVGESFRVIVAGAAAGWLVVYGIYIHLVRPAPFSAAVFVGLPTLLLAVAAASCWLPARRVSTIDPVTTLKQE